MLLFGFVMPGVDNWAHLGGLGGGYLASFVLDPMKPERGDHVLLALVCLAVSLARRGSVGDDGPAALPLPLAACIFAPDSGPAGAGRAGEHGGNKTDHGDEAAELRAQRSRGFGLGFGARTGRTTTVAAARRAAAEGTGGSR